MIGLTLGGRYEIIEEVGKGGMANVFKAHCKLLNRMVAVKVLRQDLEADTEFLNRFNAEAQSAAGLVHPNIVSIFDFGFDQGYHYIVMEYIDGITLKQYINEKAPLDTKDALGIAYQICDALSVAHSKNIIHRDIKPHNIMITDDHRIKVTDFGIARAANGSTMTADTNILGSVHYISPEQAKGAHVDGKSDLYSLGVVIYEMLTAKVPFESDSPVAVAMKQISENPINPSEYNRELTNSVEEFTLKCISKDISKRYQNAKDMMSDIMKLLENPNAVLYPIDKEDFDATRKLKMPDNINSSDVVINQHKSRNNTLQNEGKKTNVESKKLIIGSIITAFLIVGIISLGIGKIVFPDAGIYHLFSKSDITVPKFIDMSYDDAKKLAEDMRLNLEIRDEIEDESKEEGTIVGQDPEKGDKLSEGDIVYIDVTVGLSKIKVNNVALTRYESGRRELEEAGFIVEPVFENNDDVPENYIIKQEPEGGEMASHGSTVKIFISKGPEEKNVIVPQCVGKTLEQAEASIENEGLVVGDVTYEKSVVDQGIVIKQNISGGETVRSKTPINLVISSGSGSNESTNNKTVEKTLKHRITSDKSSVTIKVTEGNNTVYEGKFKPQENPDFSIVVSGSGVKIYEIYVDGNFEVAKTINFSSED